MAAGHQGVVVLVPGRTAATYSTEAEVLLQPEKSLVPRFMNGGSLLLRGFVLLVMDYEKWHAGKWRLYLHQQVGLGSHAYLPTCRVSRFLCLNASSVRALLKQHLCSVSSVHFGSVVGLSICSNVKQGKFIY